MKLTKAQLKQIIKEELIKEDEGEYPEQRPQEEAQYEVMVQMGRFLAKLSNQGHDELANEFDQILMQARDAGMVRGKG